MRIASFGCRGYKAFKNETSMEIRPLTLIIGKNNSGKSVLLRLPKLIMRAIADDTGGPFPLEADGVRFGEVFQDLVYNRLPHGELTLSIRIEHEQQALDLSADVRHVQDTRSIDPGGAGHAMVSRLEIREPEAFNLVWDRRSTELPQYGDHGQVTFFGLLPTGSQEWDFLTSWRARAKLIEQNIDHLGPLRREIPPSVRLSAKNKLGIDGDAAILWLAGDDELLEKTSQWLQEHMEGWRLTLVKQGKNIECEVSRGDVTVNLAYAGQGLHQLLPIVVRQLAQQKENADPRLLIVEQPELHLHGAAEAPVGDLLIETARKNNGTAVLVETHSENMLLRIRRRIAEGAIAPDLVALYWVEEHDEGFSSVRPISINEKGEVDWWPRGIFSEGYDEVRALRRAERNHRKEIGR